jgi:hypothetical protein
VEIAELSQINIQISLWKKSDPNEKSQQHNIFLKGEFFIFLKKYMQARKQTETIDNSTKMRARKLQISNFSTWYKGKKVGNSSMLIKVLFLPFFEQMQCGVMTEMGLRRGKITIMKGFHFKTNPIVDELNELILNLDVGYDRISREQQILFKDESLSDGEVSFELWRDVKGNLTKLDDILNDTNRRSTKTFIYSKKKELYEIQNTFLTLGETLLKGCFYLESNGRVQHESPGVHRGLLPMFGELIKEGRIGSQFPRI